MRKVSIGETLEEAEEEEPGGKWFLLASFNSFNYGVVPYEQYTDGRK